MNLKMSMIAALVATMSVPSLTFAAPSGHLRNRAWTLRHLGPNGLAKCRAFKAVVRHTLELQKAGGGTISPMQQSRLSSELAAAKAMTPKHVTAFQCGVPL